MTMRALVVPASLSLLAACGGGGSAPPADAELTTLGGIVAVTEGPLAGLALEIPPGALPGPVPIRFAKTRALAVPGFRPLGDCFRISPMPTAMHLPVLLTVPYDQNDQTGTEVVVLCHGADGEVIELGPAQTPEPGIGKVAIGSFGSFWVGERLYDGLPAGEFLPLDDGNEWTFDDGRTLRVVMTFDEPNLEGEFIFKLEFTDANGRREGFYCERDWVSGAARLRGRYDATAPGVQILHDPTPFVPAGVTIGRPVVTVHGVALHEPFGGAATGTATAFSRRVAELPGVEVTPAGTFDDLLDVTLDTRLQRLDGGEVTLPLTLRLQRFVGPVAWRDASGWTRVVAGTVGGTPL